MNHGNTTIVKMIFHLKSAIIGSIYWCHVIYGGVTLISRYIWTSFLTTKVRPCWFQFLQNFNSGTHTAQMFEQRPFFLLFLHDNLRKSKNNSTSVGLKFIEDLIFLAKKIFLTKSQKLATEWKFDVQHKNWLFSRK